MLVNPTNPENDVDLKYVQEAAHTIKQSILVLGASKESDFPAVFVTLAERRARALLVGNDVFFNICPYQSTHSSQYDAAS